MTELDRISERIADHARDLRLNLRSVLSPEGAPGLTATQIWMVAVASARAARNRELSSAIDAAAAPHIDAQSRRAALTAAALMGMNNVYYRFLHLVEDADYSAMPARLRMNAIANPGVPAVDFELMSLAVSAINGCGRCIVAHEKQLRGHGLSRETIQSAVRIAAVINGVAAAIEPQPASEVASGLAA